MLQGFDQLCHFEIGVFLSKTFINVRNVLIRYTAPNNFFLQPIFYFTCRWCFLILEIRSPYKILVIGAVVRLYRQVGSSIIRLRINVVALNLLQGQEKTPTDFLFCFHFLPWARIMHAAERRRHVESERYLRIVMEAAAKTTFSITRLPFRSCTFFSILHVM